MHPTPAAKGDFDVFSTPDFLELDITNVSKQGITLSKNRKGLIIIRAAEKTTSYGIPMVLANGGTENPLTSLASGSQKGTLFLAE